MVKPFIEIRPTVGLGIGLRSKISVILPRNVDESIQAEAYEYPRFGNGATVKYFLIPYFWTESKEKEGPYEKLESRCQKYGEPVCENHSKLVCKNHLSRLFHLSQCFSSGKLLSTNRSLLLSKIFSRFCRYYLFSMYVSYNSYKQLITYYIISRDCTEI